MDTAVIGQEAFSVCVVEIGPMIDRGLLGGCTTENFGAPGVAVG